jgi:hypothetical protein
VYKKNIKTTGFLLIFLLMTALSAEGSKAKDISFKAFIPVNKGLIIREARELIYNKKLSIDKNIIRQKWNKCPYSQSVQEEFLRVLDAYIDIADLKFDWMDYTYTDSNNDGVFEESLSVQFLITGLDTKEGVIPYIYVIYTAKGDYKADILINLNLNIKESGTYVHYGKNLLSGEENISFRSFLKGRKKELIEYWENVLLTDKDDVDKSMITFDEIDYQTRDEDDYVKDRLSVDFFLKGSTTTFKTGKTTRVTSKRYAIIISPSKRRRVRYWINLATSNSYK